MNLLWSMPIPCENPWPGQFEDYFTKQNGQVLFFFENRSVCAVSRVDGQAQIVHFPPIPDLPLLTHWRLREDLVPPLLLLTDKYAIDLQALQLVTHDHPLEKRRYATCFQLGEYHIEHNHGHILTCTKDGQQVWRLRMHGYLYTPIHPWQDLIYFGTAGSGGYLYALRLETGEVVTAVKTGGTVYIARDENWCYVLANAPKAKLLKVDITSGIIAEEIPLPGLAKYSGLRLIDGRIHAITYRIRNNQVIQVLWNCVSV